MRRKRRKRRKSSKRRRVRRPSSKTVRFSKTKLRRWSTLVRVRDKFVCYLCESKGKRWEMESHHIYPKSVYPDKAYDLANGVCLCNNCHQRLIHHTRKSWRKFTCFFRRHVDKKAMVEFNRKNASKVHKRRKRRRRR